VLAHRGACRAAPENTIEAFVRAREQGADGIELDVRRSADGELVVHHDARTDAVGVLAEQPLAAIRAAMPSVPTLAEVLDVCAGWLVNVEVKCLPWEPDPDPERYVARAAADLVRTRDVGAVISSFDLGTVDAVRAYAPEIPTALLTHNTNVETAARLAREHGHAWLHPDRTSMLAAPHAVTFAHDAGLRVDVWTVDDPQEMRSLAAAGVDAIITNVPDVALAVLTEARS
jgi:glycerophosphoryl diester phosphodiesterase